ncbi:MAG: hypothetical protein WCX95_01605 [Candidatus Gracilibacteria bacterium]
MTDIDVNNLIEKKKQTKKAFAKRLSFSYKKPLLGIFLDKELSKEEAKKIKGILEGTASINMEVIILADSNIDEFSIPHVIFMPYSRANRKDLLESADMALVLHFNDVDEFLLNGIIPVSGLKDGLKDYNPNFETGNSFTYKSDNSWGIFAALVRAMETFKFPFDWRNIVSEGVRSVKG